MSNEKDMRLSQAIFDNNFDLAESLIQSGANTQILNQFQTKTNSNLYHYAVETNNIKLCQFLVKHKEISDINHPGVDNWTPIDFALVRNQIDFIELLLLNGANIDEWTTENNDRGGYNIRIKHNKHPSGTPNNLLLHIFVCKDNLKIVEYLIKQNPSCINQQCKNGLTPLDIALIHNVNQPEMVDLLLVHGANINKTIELKNAGKGNIVNHTIATNCCTANLIKLFNNKKINISLRDIKNYTPFMLAVSNENMAVAWELITHNADTSINNYDFNIFHLLKTPDEKFIQLFLSNKVDINKKSSETFVKMMVSHLSIYATATVSSISPVLMAFLLNKIELADLFMRHGANADDIKHYKSPETGDTTLHLYTEIKNINQLEFIIRHKLIDNIDSKNNKNFTPLMCAIKHQNFAGADKLIQAGASIETLKDWKDSGRDFICYLMENKNHDGIQYLHGKGYFSSGFKEPKKIEPNTFTLLMYAIENNQFNVADTLVSAGAKTNHLTTYTNNSIELNKDSFLHYLIRKKNIEAFKYLLTKKYFSSDSIDKIDLESIKNHEPTPLMYAIATNQLEIADILIQMGANKERLRTWTNSKGNETILHYLIRNCKNADAFKYLKKIECLPSLKAISNYRKAKTPQELAVELRNTVAEQWLKEEEELQLTNKQQTLQPPASTISKRKSKSNQKKSPRADAQTIHTPAPVKQKEESKNPRSHSADLPTKKQSLIDNLKKLKSTIDNLNKTIDDTKTHALMSHVINKDITISFDKTQKSLKILLDDIAKLQTDVEKLIFPDNIDEKTYHSIDNQIETYTQNYLELNKSYLSADSDTSNKIETFTRRKLEVEKSQKSYSGLREYEPLKANRQNKPNNKKSPNTVSVQRDREKEEEEEKKEESFFTTDTLSPPRRYQATNSMLSHIVYHLSPEEAYATKTSLREGSDKDKNQVGPKSSESPSKTTISLDNHLDNICTILNNFKNTAEIAKQGGLYQLHNISQLNSLLIFIQELEPHYNSITLIARTKNITIPPQIMALDPKNTTLKDFVNRLNPYNEATNLYNKVLAYYKDLENINHCISACNTWKVSLAKPISSSPFSTIYSPAQDNSNNSETIVSQQVSGINSFNT